MHNRAIFVVTGSGAALTLMTALCRIMDDPESGFIDCVACCCTHLFPRVTTKKSSFKKKF